ncbi:MAG: hypothetical protein AAGA56_11855 [Myxococcota bacterium]
MAQWREELIEAIKSKAERDAEEAERQRKRLEAALAVADEAMGGALDGLSFVEQQLKGKSQPVALEKGKGSHRLQLHEQSLEVSVSRDDAVVKVSFNGGRPREFDFAKDRHLAPKDVEEYVGRRAVELARSAQKTHPW